MPRILRNLRIEEVSGVDRGAGEGVRVLLMKRDDAPPNTENDDMTKLLDDPATKKSLEDMIAKAVGDASKASGEALAKANAEIAFLKMSPEHQEYATEMKLDGEALTKFVGADVEGRDKVIKEFPPKKAKKKGAKDGSDIDKADDEDSELAKRVAKSEGENADLRKRLDGYEHDKQVILFGKRAIAAGLKEEDGELMRKAYGGDADSQAALDKRIGELTKQNKTLLEKGDVFRENGTALPGGGDAYKSLEAKAEELRKTEAGSKLSPQQAFTKVYTDPANAELAQQHRADEAKKRFSVVA